MEHFPKILLVAEALPNQNEKGISQTLFNLFKNYPEDKIVLCKPAYDRQNDKIQKPFNKSVYDYKSYYIPYINKVRIPGIKSLLEKVNYFISGLIPPLPLKRLRAENCDLILVIPMGHTAVWTAHYLYKQLNIKKLAVYLMDDWITAMSPGFIKERTEENLNHLLLSASGWMMISKYLAEELETRYNYKPAKILVIHNPVDEKIIVEKVDIALSKDVSIVYAGSIWPMHYDALEVAAKAIFELRKNGNSIHLKIYSPPYFWEMNKGNLEPLGVLYEGNKDYEQIHTFLRKAGILLVCSSFAKENKSFSGSSVQTKITDYLAAGKPVLSIGPSYSACNRFILENEVGTVCETKDIGICQNVILSILQNAPESERLVQNGISLLKEKLNDGAVFLKLTDFLNKL